MFILGKGAFTHSNCWAIKLKVEITNFYRKRQFDAFSVIRKNFDWYFNLIFLNFHSFFQVLVHFYFKFFNVICDVNICFLFAFQAVWKGGGRSDASCRPEFHLKVGLDRSRVDGLIVFMTMSVKIVNARLVWKVLLTRWLETGNCFFFIIIVNWETSFFMYFCSF